MRGNSYLTFRPPGDRLSTLIVLGSGAYRAGLRCLSCWAQVLIVLGLVLIVLGLVLIVLGAVLIVLGAVLIVLGAVLIVLGAVLIVLGAVLIVLGAVLIVLGAVLIVLGLVLIVLGAVLIVLGAVLIVLGAVLIVLGAVLIVLGAVLIVLGLVLIVLGAVLIVLGLVLIVLGAVLIVLGLVLIVLGAVLIVLGAGAQSCASFSPCSFSHKLPASSFHCRFNVPVRVSCPAQHDATKFNPFPPHPYTFTLPASPTLTHARLAATHSPPPAPPSPLHASSACATAFPTPHAPLPSAVLPQGATRQGWCASWAHGGDAAPGGRAGPHTYVFTHMHPRCSAPSTIIPFPPRPCLSAAPSGGHTAEMLCLVGALDHGRYSPRCYIAAATDAISLPKARQLEATLAQEPPTSSPAPASPVPPPCYLSVYRSREVGQSYLTSVLTTIAATLHAMLLVARVRPQLLLCNGPGTCLPICIAVFTLHVLGVQSSSIVFVESVARVEHLSLTGRLLHRLGIVDRFFVQWPHLTATCKGTQYVGRLM
ncbi:unnamed protein product [Closterium sp. Yama58-4]|nr:unnamed protein product [Closterium sp. Yama58-4]